MDALGITIAVLLVIGTVLFIAFFIFVASFIFKTFKKVTKDQKDFDQRWNSDAWNRFRK